MVEAPERIWATFELHESGKGHPHTYATASKTKGQEYIRADIAAARALAERAGRLLDPDMPAQEIRLHMGEMTAQEMRTARAAIRWANTRQAERAGGVKECATEGCDNAATIRFERGGVGSDYCGPCYLKVQAIPHTITTEPAAPEGRQEAVAFADPAALRTTGRWLDVSRTPNARYTQPLYTRPAEQAVTEAAVEAFGHTWYGAAWPIERKAGRGADVRAALKAAMEAGR